jgi:hypothetical protein
VIATTVAIPCPAAPSVTVHYSLLSLDVGAEIIFDLGDEIIDLPLRGRLAW